LTFLILGVTVHFADNWSLKSFLLDFIEMADDHSGAEIAKNFITVLKNYEIEKKVGFFFHFFLFF